jgi:hypothetical protein
MHQILAAKQPPARKPVKDVLMNLGIPRVRI